MNEQELIELIAEHIYKFVYAGEHNKSWGRLIHEENPIPEFSPIQDYFRKEAKQIIALVKEAGWKSPEMLKSEGFYQAVPFKEVKDEQV